MPLRERWESSAGSFSKRDSLLVRAVMRFKGRGGWDEAEGWGECTALPEPSFNAEYTEAALEVSVRHLVPALLRAGVVTAAGVSPALAAVKGHQMAKAAFEAAVLDAELRAEGARLADHLADLSCGQEGRSPKEFVEAGVSVGLAASPGALLATVEGYIEQGYRRVKLKIRPGWDAVPVTAVREYWPELVLAADANCAYSALGVPGAASALQRLDGLGLAYLEQPLAFDDLAGHAELAGLLGTPICLDEPLTSLAAVRAALALAACSVVSVKPGRLGGYLEAVRVHDLCMERGVGLCCGGMVETGIGRAGNVALASLHGFSLPGDLSASGRFFDEDIAALLALEPGGVIRVPRGPGHGVEVSAEAIGAFTIWRRWWPAAVAETAASSLRCQQ